MRRVGTHIAPGNQSNKNAWVRNASGSELGSYANRMVATMAQTRLSVQYNRLLGVSSVQYNRFLGEALSRFSDALIIAMVGPNKPSGESLRNRPGSTNKHRRLVTGLRTSR